LRSKNCWNLSLENWGKKGRVALRALSWGKKISKKRVWRFGMTALIL
jgi:hypothetical protein